MQIKFGRKNRKSEASSARPASAGVESVGRRSVPGPPSPGRQSFIDPLVLQKLSSLQLVAKVVVQGFVSGLHRSPYHGFSVDFAEYREYNEGDDLRNIDWNVFARTDRYYIKKYQGETNTALHFLLDVSGSMHYGSGNVHKLDYARFLVASLGYFAYRQKDAIGLYLFDDAMREFLPPRLRRTHMNRFLTTLERVSHSGSTGWQQPLEKIAQLVTRRGIVLIVSDFYSDLEDLFRGIRVLQSRGHDAILFQILDPYELEFPFDGLTLLEDVETRDRVMVAPQASRRHYLEAFTRHQETLRSEAAASGADWMLLRTDRPLDEALLHYLTVRHRRR
ncbi:MAG: DUF58 domain-containing protein [Acidobacteria bacterium]|nr:DUF58 domain-containing protein [Acidobacteriota bacterium]